MCLEAHGQTRNVAVWPCSSNAANNSQWSFNATTGALKSLGTWTRGLCLTTTTLPHAPAQADANAPVPPLAAVPSGTSYQVTVSDHVAFPNLVVVPCQPIRFVDRLHFPHCTVCLRATV